MKMKTYMLLFGLIALIVISSSSLSQAINFYGIVEGIEYNPSTRKAIANLYIAYDQNYDLSSSIIIGCYLSRDTVKDAQDKKFLEITLEPLVFFDSYIRRDVDVDMSGETGNWYILTVIDEKNNFAETNEKDNIIHSSMFTVGGGATGIYNTFIDTSSAQIFPNPFYDKTTVSFSMAQKAQVSIIIYNALGKEVATVVNRNLQAGTYNYDFEKKNLPSGIYYCTMTSANRTISKKMMIY